MSRKGDDDNINAWDDEVLVKSYEKSLKFTREELARHIAAKTNNNGSTSHRRNSREDEVKEKKIDADENLSVNLDDEEPYLVGDYIRATYDGDGKDYEAYIVSVNNEFETCIVRFIGYNNDQKVYLADLVPSWGQEERDLQMLKARKCDSECDEEEVSANEGYGRQSQQRKHKSSKKSKPHQTYKGSKHEFDMMGMMPTPPPPLPPLFKDDFPDDAEHLSAMLMSWYMSGYYTGVYQGIQLCTKTKEKQQQKKKDKANK